MSEEKVMTVGDIKRKLNEYPDDMHVVLINESSNVYAQDVNRYVDEDGKLETFVSIDGRKWIA